MALLPAPVQAQEASGTAAGTAPSVSYGWLRQEREEFCRTAANQPPKLDEESDYPPQAHDEQVNAGSRTTMQSFRGEDEFLPVMRSCPLVPQPGGGSDGMCGDAFQAYASGLLMYAAPLMIGVASLFVWNICCLVALCRCCRRCCLCSERKGPRPAQIWQKGGVLIVLLTCSIAMCVSALTALGYTGEINGGMTDMLCNLFTLADETLNGSPEGPIFLGIEEGINRLTMIRRMLDVDGRAMTDVRAILDETAGFAAAMDGLLLKVEHMRRVLSIVGERKVKAHSCWFCRNALGNNATGELGLLNELVLSVQQSSAEAMRNIQKAASDTLTGKPLVEVSTSVRRGGVALENFKRGFAGTWVDSISSWLGLVRTVEDARHTGFRALCAFCVFLAAVLSNLTVYQTRRSKKKYPGSAPALVTWCAGFCAVSLALLFAGGLILACVPVSEVCHFWRYDLLTHGGISDYYQQIGLFDPTSLNGGADDLAVDVWRTCMTPEGTGDILGALQLRQRLDFQRVLHESFITLEDVNVGAVIDTAKYELLVSQAQSFGGLFVFDPDEPLPLEPNAAPKMIGSSVEPDDQEGPDGESLIYGLNTYARLIAGPGQYSFASGTAGGGTVITATTPSEEDLQGELVVRQNALYYARLKEQILTEPDVFRCDLLDSQYQVTERVCSYEEFKASVIAYAQEVRDAGVTVGEEAQRARQLVASDMQNSLRQLLAEVRALRERFRCRFIWRRWENFDFSLCNVALPGMLNAALTWMIIAGFALLLVITHYKMWRHLLDNRVVGEELERFSKKYGYLSTNK